MRKVFGILKIYTITSLMVMALVGLLVVHYERSLEIEVFSKEISSYRSYLGNFFNQDWAIIALRNRASGTVSREAKNFVNYKTKCMKFLSDQEEVGSFGQCLGLDYSTDIIGWSNVGENLILKDNYRNSIQIVTVLENPEKFKIMGTNSIFVPLKTKHLTRALDIIAICFFVFNLLFLIWFTIRRIQEQKEKSNDKIHDFSHIAEDTIHLSRELDEAAENPAIIREIATQRRRVGELREATLYDGPPNKCEIIELGPLIEDFIGGFFDSKDKSVLSITPFNRNISINTDRRLFLKSLSNLFDNAFKEVFGKSTFTFTILEGPADVEFVVSNNGAIKNPKQVFKKGFSSRNSSGRGLFIVNEILAKIETEPYLLHSSGSVCFCFSLNKHMEAPCRIMLF